MLLGEYFNAKIIAVVRFTAEGVARVSARCCLR